MDVFSKIDLHIHSAASGKTKSGDYEITKESTTDNIDILVSKLNENNINVCSITDHNFFDKSIYLKLKSKEGEGSLKKVLPGVELDLEIKSKIVHTICIFNDSVINHADLIDRNFKSREKYTLSQLGELLSDIGLDVILIAHQKSDYLGENQNLTNLSSCGKETFYKMIGIEYFDSLEVQSSKVEGILKNRFFQDEIYDQTLISGSDCHDWSVYPLHDKHKTIKPLLMNMKAEPTFRGLVMAITNTKRFCIKDLSNKVPAISEINFVDNGVKKSIPLSYGINAIIGDNSVGKSTLIQALLGIAPPEAINFYKKHGIIIEKASLVDSDYEFNKQGDIRKKFDETQDKLPIQEDFKQLFIKIDTSNQVKIISDLLSNFVNLWNDNEERYINQSKLKTTLEVSSYDLKNSYFLLFKSNITAKNNKFNGITKAFAKHIESLVDLVNSFNDVIQDTDLEQMRAIYKSLMTLKRKYAELELKILFENKIINCFSTCVTNYQNATEKRKSTEESNYNNYLENITRICTNFQKELIFKNTKSINPFKDYKDIHINMIDNQKGDYHFLSKPIFNDKITKDLIINFIKSKIDVEDIFSATKSEILRNIKNKRFNDKVCMNLDELKKALLEEFKTKYFKTTVELKYGDDNLDEGNSAGINSLYYLDIESYIFDKKLFVIDQPEDDVSQTKINTVLLRSLKNFSKEAQVILVTHNPQLVVNLDVDNVIVLKKEKNNHINFISGPLERFDKDVDMIKLIADTLEGGVEVIKKRWKRYDKAN